MREGVSFWSALRFVRPHVRRADRRRVLLVPRGDEPLSDLGAASGGGARDAAATGSSSGQPPDDDDDAGTSPPRDAGGDASEPSAACDPSHGVGPLLDMPGLVNATDYRTGARLTPDELEVVFLQVRNPSDNQSPYDAYLASRGASSEPFGAPRRIESALGVYAISISADGLSMYYTPQGATGQNGLMVTTRASRDAEFAGNVVVRGAPEWSYSPFATADGALLFSQYPAQSPSSIMRGVLGNGVVSASSQLFFTGQYDIDFPTLSSDGVELFYSEYLSESDGAFRRAVREGAAFLPAALPSGIDEKQHEVTWVSADACRIYVTDWRAATLKVAQRLP